MRAGTQIAVTFTCRIAGGVPLVAGGHGDYYFNVEGASRDGTSLDWGSDFVSNQDMMLMVRGAPAGEGVDGEISPVPRQVPMQPRLAGDDRKRKSDDGSPGTSVITKTKPQTKRPNMYRVLLLNDDYTPMEFVVHVLERFFKKDREAATRIMLHVHHHGIGECGIFTYEIAETKVTQVMDFARKHQHPLQCVMEKK